MSWASDSFIDLLIMRLAWIIDVHLDFLSGDEVRAFCGRLARRGLDALVISGDIAHGGEESRAHPAAGGGQPRRADLLRAREP